MYVLHSIGQLWQNLRLELAGRTKTFTHTEMCVSFFSSHRNRQSIGIGYLMNTRFQFPVYARDIPLKNYLYTNDITREYWPRPPQTRFCICHEIQWNQVSLDCYSSQLSCKKFISHTCVLLSLSLPFSVSVFFHQCHLVGPSEGDGDQGSPVEGRQHRPHPVLPLLGRQEQSEYLHGRIFTFTSCCMDLHF